MTDDEQQRPESPSPWAAPGGDVPSSTDAGGSSLPPPPSPPVPPTSMPSASLAAPPPAPAEAIVVAPVESDPPSSSGRWFVRAAAAAVAALVIAGGAYLAVSAGGGESGGDTPEQAVAQMWEALAAEDLVGAAELVEPGERESIVAAGFDVVDELVRLEILAADLDLGAVGGIDLEIDDLSLTSAEVVPGIVTVTVESGTVDLAYDVAELPFGPLILDRAPDGELTEAGSTRGELPRGFPITTVERDGRWYVSLWYSVAEGARLATDAPVPDPARALAPLGAETPSAAVELLAAAAVDLDLRTVLRLLDPSEAAALHDYAPLFLDDAEAAIAELRRAAVDEGVAWDLTGLRLAERTDGDRSTVVVEAFEMSIAAPEFSMAASVDGTSMRMQIEETSWDGTRIRTSVVYEDGCVVIENDQNGEVSTDRVCDDELLAEAGFAATFAEGFGDEMFDVGVRTHRVDGRWYVSPIDSVSHPMLAALRSMHAEDVAAMVDGFAESMESMADSLGGFDPLPATDDPGFPFDDGVQILPTSTTTPDEPFEPVPPPPATDNEDLLANAAESSFVWDLDAFGLQSEYDSWLPGVPPPTSDRGVTAQFSTESGAAYVIVVDTGSPEAAAEHMRLVAGLDGATIAEPDKGVVQTVDTWDDPVLVGASGARVVIVGTFGASIEDMASVLAAQLAL